MDKPVDGAEARLRDAATSIQLVVGVATGDLRAMLTHPAALVAENERLERELAKRNRTAIDRRYMIDALVQMLGPKGLRVWKAWRDQGVERLHTSWGPDAAALTGEERAQVHLDLNEAIKTAVPIDNIDGDMPQIDVRDLFARTALETRNG